MSNLRVYNKHLHLHLHLPLYGSHLRTVAWLFALLFAFELLRVSGKIISQIGAQCGKRTRADLDQTVLRTISGEGMYGGAQCDQKSRADYII